MRGLLPILCFACLHVWLSLLGSDARAEPASGAFAPAPSHAGDEREFPPATVRAYQRVMEQGLSEFVVGRWAEARALFQRGHVLLPNARSSRVLGMTAFNLALYPAAMRELKQALSDPRRPLQGALREQTETVLAQAEALVGRYRVLLEPSSAQLRVDGLVTKLEPDGTLLLAVGHHQLEVEAPHYRMLTRALSVDGSDEGVLVLRLDARLEDGRIVQPNAGADLATPARGWQQKIFADYRATWALGAGTFALASATFGVQLSAANLQHWLEVRCMEGACPDPERAIARRDRLDAWGQGLLMSSLSFAVTTAVLAFVERDRARARERQERKARLAPLREPP